MGDWEKISGDRIQNRPLGYRAEIDGLRAVAILSVLFFHLRIGLGGGFVGVDVFFVISGYLITGMILKEVDQGRFQMAAFWERRARRILPALAVVLAASLLAGWMLLIPEHFQELGQSIVAQVLFASNFFFWTKSGYFADGVELRPLFHTWSLAVEEQFYLLFPLLLVALKRLSPRRRLVVILVLGAISFALSIYCSYRHTDVNFYFLPTRAWELLLGAMLVLLPMRRSLSQRIAEMASAIGILLIFTAVLLYDHTTRFPGLSAMLPCGGAALFIWANSQTRTAFGRILAARPVVFIGLISYSLYLWHWPVLVFSQYLALGPLSFAQALAVIVASFLLATLSWKLVETPIRSRTLLASRAQLVSFATVAAGLLLSAGVAIVMTGGMPGRLTPDALQYAEARHDRAFLKNVSLSDALSENFLELGTADPSQSIALMVWGDSHAMAVLPLLDTLCREREVRGVAAVHTSQAPLAGYESGGEYSLEHDSLPFNEAVLGSIRRHAIHDVVLVASWSGYADRDRGIDRLHRGVLETVSSLHRIGTRVWILKPVPRHPWDIPNALVAAVLSGRDPESVGGGVTEHRMLYQRLDPIFDGIDIPDVKLLDPTTLFQLPDGHFRVAEHGHAFYCDTHHLTIHGAMVLRPLFEPIFEQLKTSR